ncbi:hypothetical protein [Pseudofrankia inefficax]|uniref:Uncharacterized protein n=1 Tax=Pseudofrankia inefficax (strain DSM 45817 / CECT 9037 / DDB 130130 / EuI1c) TaxID=298654 RepID=E3IZJ0_PSEI1|nr:hypothetical protein [Pseudofrankia inefficax]ADP82760.1 hypothetical protein FraEuI1c_4770 [Pseudofrankia inefficax]
MTGSRGAAVPADPPALGGAGVADLSGRLAAGDPTALADAYTRFSDRLLEVAAGHAQADGAAAVRAVLARLWEHPLRYPAGDDALAAALDAATSQYVAEQPARGAERVEVRGPGPARRPRPRLPGPLTGPTRSADDDAADPRVELLATALAYRPAVAATPPYAAPFAAWTATVDRVLAELSVLDWDRPTGHDGRTPREVVARLAGLDAALATAIGIPVAGALAQPGADPAAEGIVPAMARQAGSGATAGRQAGPAGAGTGGGARPDGVVGGSAPVRPAAYWPAVFWPPVFWPPVLLWRTWHEGARGLCAWLAGREPEAAKTPVDAFGWTAPVEDHLVSRMLGTWLDGSAIAAAAGVRLPALRATELRAATRLALGRVRWPGGPDGAGSDPAPLTLALTRVDPTGQPAAGRPGGAVVVGRWLVGPGREPLALPSDGPAGSQPPPGGEVCLDVVDFCLLATGRRGPVETAADGVLTASPAAGRALLAGMAAVLPA